MAPYEAQQKIATEMQGIIDDLLTVLARQAGGRTE
jgi:hypothetical protein